MGELRLTSRPTHTGSVLGGGGLGSTAGRGAASGGGGCPRSADSPDRGSGGGRSWSAFGGQYSGKGTLLRRSRPLWYCSRTRSDLRPALNWMLELDERATQFLQGVTPAAARPESFWPSESARVHLPSIWLSGAAGDRSCSEGKPRTAPSGLRVAGGICDRIHDSSDRIRLSRWKPAGRSDEIGVNHDGRLGLLVELHLDDLATWSPSVFCNEYLYCSMSRSPSANIHGASWQVSLCIVEPGQ